MLQDPNGAAFDEFRRHTPLGLGGQLRYQGFKFLHVRAALGPNAQLGIRVEPELERFLVVRHAAVEHQLEHVKIGVLMFPVAAKYVVMRANPIAKMPVNVVFRPVMLNLEHIDLQSLICIQSLMVR